MGVAALVLGIVSLVCIIIPMAGLLGGILGIVGVILGALGRKAAPEGKTGLATAGLVCSIIGTIFNLLAYVACAACAGGLASMF